ncbi:N-acetyl-1-D-myo-inositol-2-amino-2-deoxy-alpha-D -glucopyranoside deacetylase [Glycomyces albus]
MTERGIMFVHAHPDDETVSTGATIAHYAARDDAHVTVVTCTLGEEGEVRVSEFAQLAADHADQLGGFRYWEYRHATAALGVEDTHFLGGVGRWRDSGMMGLPSNDHPRSFWRADPDEAADLLVELIRERRPEVLVTYDPDGFYGHPDHIQAHRVAMRAADLAGRADRRPELGPPHHIRKVYWTTMPTSALEEHFDTFKSATDNPFEDVESPRICPSASPTTKSTPACPATGPPPSARWRRCAPTAPRSRPATG